MENTTRPFRLGQLFSFSFKLYGKDFWKMFLTALVGMAIIAIPVVVCIIGLMGKYTDANSNMNFGIRNNFSYAEITNFIISGIVIFVVALAVGTFIQGILLTMTSSRFKGMPLKFKEAFHLTAERYGKLILTALSNIVLVLPLIAIYVAVYIAFINQIHMGSVSVVQNITVALIMLLMNLVYYAVTFYFSLVFRYSWCITINEDVYAFRALGRAFSLVGKSGFWKNIGNYVVMLLAISGAVMVSYFIFGMFFSIGAAAIFLMAFMAVIFVLIYIAFIAAICPFEYIYTQLMYFNARILTEGKPF
jgi:hypothetical protein